MTGIFAALLAAALSCAAQDPGVGASRDDIIARYGAPRNVLSAGAREILTYPFGRVILESGRVVRCEWTQAPPADTRKALAARDRPAAASPPPAPAQASSKQAAVGEALWTTDFNAALARARETHRRVLALFTGSDWCPACQEFEAQVAHNADFERFVRTPFVLVKLDYPRESELPAALRSQNEALSRTYKIRAFPTILLIEPDGSGFVAVDNQKGREADGMADYYIQAIDEARRRKPEKEGGWWPF